MHLHSHINTALKIIDGYSGSMPLAQYLKNYFSQNKKHGSKDRKNISALCYSYYRLGHALKNVSIAERLKVAVFLCKPAVITYDEVLPKEWLQHIDESIENRYVFIEQLYQAFSVKDVFPFARELSDGAGHIEYAQSYFSQPDLFIRARPGYMQELEARFNSAGLAFKKYDSSCFAFSNTTKIDAYLQINKEAVIQDYASQKVGDFILDFKQQLPLSVYEVWDCCAASGGKSLLAYDILKNIDLAVSDIRPTIMHKLHDRFKEAGIKQYRPYIVDLTSPPLKMPHQKYDLIICDAPCSGSGTWGRTPEQLFFFDDKKINEYSLLQKNILKSVVPYLSANGSLLYITCSVFAQENEEIVTYVEKNFSLNVKKMELLKGLHVYGDTIFAAIFK